MVYIRNKKIKGIDYSYLVESKWDPINNTSKQITIKYLGKASNVSIEDIPEEYRNHPKITEFISLYHLREQKETLLIRLRDEMFHLLKEYDIEGLTTFYNMYSKLFGQPDFYDKLLKPIMYKIGDEWEKGILDVATEHVCTNAANNMIKIINKNLVSKSKNKPEVKTTKKKILICTPEGELHHLACNVIESLLLSKGYSVYNISPSIPADSFLDYVKSIEPNLFLISVTLEENIKPVKRLVDKVQLAYSKRIPILIGGAAFSRDINKNKNDFPSLSDNKIILTGLPSFKEILKTISDLLPK